MKRITAFGLILAIELACGCHKSVAVSGEDGSGASVMESSENVANNATDNAPSVPVGKSGNKVHAFRVPQGEVVVAGYQRKAYRLDGQSAGDRDMILKAPNVVGPLRPMGFCCSFSPIGASVEFKDPGSVLKLVWRDKDCVALGVYAVIGEEGGLPNLWGPLGMVTKRGGEKGLVALFGIPGDAAIEDLTLVAGEQSLAVADLAELRAIESVVAPAAGKKPGAPQQPPAKELSGPTGTSVGNRPAAKGRDGLGSKSWPIRLIAVVERDSVHEVWLFADGKTTTVREGETFQLVGFSGTVMRVDKKEAEIRNTDGRLFQLRLGESLEEKRPGSQRQ